MKTTDILRRASKSLRQSKARTLLTSLAIAVGAFTLTLSLAAGEGSRDYADKLIGSNINPRTLFIVKDKTLFEGGAAQSTGIKEYDPNISTAKNGPSIRQLTEADLQKLQARNDIENVQPTYQLSPRYVSVEGNNKKYTADVTVYDPGIRSETSNGSLPPVGKNLTDSDIVMPESFADTIGMKKSDLIGKKVTITFSKPATPPSEDEIKRILATEGTAGFSKLAQGENKEITFTIRALSKKSATALNASSAMQISSTQAKIFSEFTTKGTDSYQKYIAVTALAKGDREPADVKAALAKDGYPSQTAKDLQNLLFTIVNILQGIVIGFGVLALIASVFGIINTQYISVLERTQQIGLMKALGMRGKDVARLFRYEAACIGFLGGIIGAGFAFALGTALNPWITQKLSLGEGNAILVFQWIPIVLLIGGLMLIAVMAGYLPARKAAKLDPIEALRTE